MTTNSLDRLEHAVKNRPGRVDQIIEIPLPDAEQRQRLLCHFARNLKLGVGDLDKLLRATEGATPAMLKEIVKRAAVSAVERLDGKHTAGPLELTEPDLLLATEQVRALRDPELTPGNFGFRDRH
jgi:ATP-dependent 26S proteasome regulatory subunit